MNFCLININIKLIMQNFVESNYHDYHNNVISRET